MKFFVYIILFLAVLIQADEYDLGRGVKLSEALNIGGYFSIDYQKSDEKKQFRLDDVAVLAYGEMSPKLTYLAEFEAAPFYVKNFTTDTSTNDHKFHHERLYIDYMYSEMFNFRIGKQIAPIGYWNLEPINVLRDTSSNPYLSSGMFPKLLTGLDIYGYLDEDHTLKYHVFMQKNEDLDAEYINIQNEHFFGLSLEYEFSSDISFGGALGQYITNEDDKHVDLVQANAKYDSYPFVLQAEAAYNFVDNKVKQEKSEHFAGYTQMMYSLDMHHALIGRYEYINDKANSLDNHIGIIGYSYRPIYSVSFKLEYQINSDAYLNKSIASFSVLF